MSQTYRGIGGAMCLAADSKVVVFLFRLLGAGYGLSIDQCAQRSRDSSACRSPHLLDQIQALPHQRACKPQFS